MAGQVAPTKSNLMKIQEELTLSKQGFELLDQKRNILIMELLTLVDQAVEQSDRMDDHLSSAYRSLEKAVMGMGRREVESIAGSIALASELAIKSRRVMGVQLPVVQTETEKLRPFYSTTGVSQWVDNSVQEFRDTLSTLGRFAELKVSIMRLAREVKKTIRKVNALEKIAIPDLEEDIRIIQSRLEENERESFTLMKMVKRGLDRKESMV